MVISETFDIFLPQLFNSQNIPFCLPFRLILLVYSFPFSVVLFSKIPSVSKNVARAVVKQASKKGSRSLSSAALRATAVRSESEISQVQERGRRGLFASANAGHGAGKTQSAPRRAASSFAASYQTHVAERAAEGIVPKPLTAEQVAEVVKLLKSPPPGEQAFLLDLLVNRVPPGVDEAAYVKAGFLAAVAKGEAKSPAITPAYATELLGTMQGGYNIEPLVQLLDDTALGPVAAKCLSHTLLVFDSFYDVEAKAKAGNVNAKAVLKSWANGEWFSARPAVPEKITVTVFKVTNKPTC